MLIRLMEFSGAESGAFSSIIGSDAADWTVLYNPGNDGQIDLRFDGGSSSSVPEPSAWLDVVFMLSLVAFRGSAKLRGRARMVAGALR